MKLRLGRKLPFSIEEIEREAQAEIDKRVSLGKPPPEEWKGLAERAGREEAPIPGRPTELNIPVPPPRPTPAATTAPAASEPAAPKAPKARKAPAAKTPSAGKAPATRKAAPRRKP